MAYSDHPFGSMAGKVDPSRVIESIKDNIHAQEFKEVSIISGTEAQNFAAMQWPLFDDGKPITTNALGYPVGGYFKRHEEALKMAKEEAERIAEIERAESDQAVVAAANAAAGFEPEPTPAPQEEAASDPISVEELEAIRNTARNEGYTEGLNQGHAEGYAKGVEQGKYDGFNQGKKDGAAEGYQDGFRQGRDEGFAKGQEAGLTAGSDMVTTQADRFRHLADMLANPIREIDENVTDEIVYIISRLARVILKRELKGDVEYLKRCIEQCYTLLPEAKHGAEIRLSENDYALMVAAIGRDYMNSQGWDMQPDETMQDGDITVNTKISSVQWRIDDRIDALISDFLTGSSDAVNSARKEVISGAPDFDETPKKQLIPPRDILGMSERIAQNMAAMAPKPDFAEELAAHVDAQAAQNPHLNPANRQPNLDPEFDPDGAELDAAQRLAQSHAEVQAMDEARAQSAAELDEAAALEQQMQQAREAQAAQAAAQAQAAADAKAAAQAAQAEQIAAAQAQIKNASIEQMASAHGSAGAEVPTADPASVATITPAEQKAQAQAAAAAAATAQAVAAAGAALAAGKDAVEQSAAAVGAVTGASAVGGVGAV